ncbi:MAG TPA: alpha/beta fold hydrolase, partial [Thermoanaerobaculia bacterium]|nr:alpha/beta fold hydrolase [Thermoanaerobaculia bacterium]
RETLEHLDLTGLRTVTMDLRGHGDSGKAASDYTDERLAKDVFSVADSIGSFQFVVVGFSMSGRFAQYLAVLDPKRVRGQVLVAGCPAAPIPLPDEIRRDWVSRAGDARRLSEVSASFTTRPVAPEILQRFGDRAAKADRDALDQTLRLCMQESFVHKLKSVKIPTLIVGGLHDTIFPPEVLRSWASTLPGARLAFLDSNHEIPIEQPVELAALISAFIAGLPE